MAENVAQSYADNPQDAVYPDAIGQIAAGGLGRPPGFAGSPSVSDDARLIYEKAHLPGQPRSLSGIALRAFVLGFVLSACILMTLGLLAWTSSPLWRLPFFLGTLSLFHYLEFWTTARYNNCSAETSSFLLSQNGSAYNIAHTLAMIECILRNTVLMAYPALTTRSTAVLIVIGMSMIVMGQLVRSCAMIEAGTNFNHIVQHRKDRKHQLVTTGLYSYLRHPSYFGFFWWGIGTQMVLGNVFCFFAYAVVLWRFFSRRIAGEEALLITFFGQDYVAYRSHTIIGIPFVR